MDGWLSTLGSPLTMPTHLLISTRYFLVWAMRIISHQDDDPFTSIKVSQLGLTLKSFNEQLTHN